MIRLSESIEVRKNIETVFEYVSDFRNIQDWDPGVISSKTLKPGASGIGMAFDLTLKFGPFRPTMKYVIIEYQPFSKVILKGTGESFQAIDTIRFNKTAHGAHIDYQADILFFGMGRLIEPYLRPFLNQVGRRAIWGLEQHFEGPKRSQKTKERFQSGTSWLDYLADHAVLPGMVMFSRYGYELSRRFWKRSGSTLYGKKVVLTGGTSGIGKAAAYELAAKNALLTIIARNREKAKQVCLDIIDRTGNPHVDFMCADLSLMKDIRGVAKQIKDSKKSMDILINNAGALFNERKETSEGIEQTFATDLLGVFHLTTLLTDSLKKSPDARIINVSSGGMYTQKIDVHDLENRHPPYNGAKAYARAKRGIVILTRLWAERFKKDGITVHAMHPGWVDTPGIERSLPKFHELVNHFLRSPKQGADTIVWLATSKKGEASTGRFWMDRRPHETVVFPGTSESGRERELLWKKLNDSILLD